jgi:hypothetical protein
VTNEQEQPTTGAEATSADDTGSVDTALTPTMDKPLSRTGAIGFGLAPRNFDEAWRMAGVFAQSALVPKDYRGKPEDILVAMQHGAEVGLPPLQSLQSIAVINGRPSIWGDGMLALIKASPLYAGHDEYYEVGGERRERLTSEDLKNHETTAVCKFWRRGRSEPYVNSFSIGQASRSGLLQKRDTPWQNYPERMLMMRARSWAARDAFPDVLRGLATVEEAMDTPEDRSVAGEGGPPPEPIRRSAKASAASETPAETERPTAPNTPVTPHVDDAASGDGAQRPAGAGKTAAAERTPAPRTQPTPGHVTKHVRITDTKVVDRRNQGGGISYEIFGNAGEAGQVGLEQVWWTEDEQLYRMAASCEGSDSTFSVTWHTAQTAKNKKDIRVITGLEAAH